jgi:hypothetical protein
VVAPLEPRIRLELIAKAHRFCGDIVTRESLLVQFHYETGEDPSSSDLDSVLRQFAKEAERCVRGW